MAPSSTYQAVRLILGSQLQWVISILEYKDKNKKTLKINLVKTCHPVETILVIAGKKPFSPTTGKVAAKPLDAPMVHIAVIHHFVSHVGFKKSCGERRPFGLWSDVGLWSHGCLGQCSASNL